MRPMTLTQTGTGASIPVMVDYRQPNFKIGMGIVAGGNTYTVEHTFDDPADFIDKQDWIDNATWFEHEFLRALSADEDGSYAYPCRAVRLNVTAGSGTSVMTLIQSSTN